MEDRLADIAQQFRSSVAHGGAVLVNPLRIYIATMGCAKNEVDSQRMAGLLADAGALLVDDAETADCIIVNTCSFIQSATEESIEVVFEMCGLSSVETGNAKVVVAGCMPSRYGDDLAASLTEVETFVPCSHEDDIVAIVATLFPGRLGATQLSFALEDPSAYVKISDGCDRFCSFCTIPFIRGRYHSYTPERIDEEVGRHIAGGAREIVLIAQDTGRYGQDFRSPKTLAWLVDYLASRYPTTWFRIMYVQPEGITDELLDVMGRHENICNYLDIPVQHANADILSAMNRKGSGKDYLALFDKIRAVLPDVTLRTTLIVGFPGETDDQFQELCNFVEEAELDYVGVFAYSAEEGTRAAQLPGQIDAADKQFRSATIRDIADSISSIRIGQRIGHTLDVLVLGREEDGQLYGRAMCQAPDVDGVVYLSRGDIGSIVSVKVEDTLLYEMEGSTES